MLQLLMERIVEMVSSETQEGLLLRLAWIISFIYVLMELMVSSHAHVIFVGQPTI